MRDFAVNKVCERTPSERAGDSVYCNKSFELNNLHVWLQVIHLLLVVSLAVTLHNLEHLGKTLFQNGFPQLVLLHVDILLSCLHISFWIIPCHVTKWPWTSSITAVDEPRHTTLYSIECGLFFLSSYITSYIKKQLPVFIQQHHCHKALLLLEFRDVFQYLNFMWLRDST